MKFSNIETTVDSVIQWCESVYGFSNNKNFNVDYEIDDIDELYHFKSEYTDDGIITIYEDEIKDIEELIQCIIHEYQHYLQSQCWYSRYEKMGYSYETHPYEIKAEQIAVNDYKKCLQVLKNKKII